MTTHESGTTALLHALEVGDPEDRIDFDFLLDRLSRRAFGVMLLLATLPTFIPLPVGVGSVSGALVVLVAVQVMLRLQHPWLPAFLRRRTLRRGALQQFSRRFDRVLGWVERYSRPRLTMLCDRVLPGVFTGVQLLLIGILLALPIPFTNFPIGFLLLIYCFALIERDGALLLIAWILGTGTIIGFGFASNNVVQMIEHWL